VTPTRQPVAQKDDPVVDTDPHHWRDALRTTASRLTSVAAPLDGPAIRGRSYDSDWTIAQVMSHIGSQSEVFDQFLAAALAGDAVPTPDAFPPIWARWDAKSPEEQVRDALAAVEHHVAGFDAITDDELASFRIEFFGMDLDAAGFINTRVSEFALHTWDVEVALQPSATLAPQAVELLVDAAPQMAARLAKPASHPFRVWTHTVDPERDLVWDCADAVAVEESTGADGEARVDLPSESLIRLLAGRLDPAHTPASVTASGVDLDEVRALFPGY
jgi:uncharacterized protein (TIGR03083 family)